MATRFTEPKVLPREDADSGLEFVTAETRALQADDFANPGLLWVDRGRAFFEQADDYRSCADCHQDRLAGVEPFEAAAIEWTPEPPPISRNIRLAPRSILCGHAEAGPTLKLYMERVNSLAKAACSSCDLTQSSPL